MASLGAAGRVWKGSAFGGVRGRTELPGIVGEYLNKKLMVDECTPAVPLCGARSRPPR